MSEPVTKWEARRVETTRRLEWCALELTRDKGFDGWTMDDLAEAAEVSRRTVFNYFDSKADVVLGPEKDIPDEVSEAFVDHGPTGRLFDDLVHLAKAAVHESHIDLDLELLRRAVICADARVVTMAHERFEAIVEQAAVLILEREGAGYGEAKARLMIRLLVIIFDSILDRVGPAEARPLTELIDDAVRDARAVLND